MEDLASSHEEVCMLEQDQVVAEVDGVGVPNQVEMYILDEETDNSWDKFCRRNGD